MGREQKETKIRSRIRSFLEGRGWLVEITHGNRFMYGFPDLFIGHPEFGQRWIDVKVEGAYQFTKAQRAKWPVWHLHKIGIWIMTDATEEQYKWLFQKPNWQSFWRSSWGDPFDQDIIDELLDQLNATK
jgi:hypothetical protein